MRKNTCVVLIGMALILIWGAASLNAVGPGDPMPKSGAVLHSLAPDTSEVGDSLVTDISAIVCTWWRQLYECFNTYHVVDYRDNPRGTPDGILSKCDYIQVDLRKNLKIWGDPGSGWNYYPADYWQHWLHVDEVTVTLKLRRQDSPEDSCFVEYVGYSLAPLSDPTGGLWRSFWPPAYPPRPDSVAVLDQATTDAGHANPADTLHTCIYVHFVGDALGLGDYWWHVEDVAIDIMVSFKNPPEAEVPTTTQWGIIVLVALIVGSAVFVMLRRRKATAAA